MGAFVVAAALIVGFVAWRANELMTSKAIEALAAEVTSLREQFQTGGPARLVASINERVAEPGSGLYLLLDAGGGKLAGNLPRLPAVFTEDRKGVVEGK